MRYLCSHLVKLVRPGASGADLSGLLEQISETDAVVSTESAVEPGERIAIETAGFQAWAEAKTCETREDGYAVVCAFDAAYRWDPGHWRPDHLYRPRPRSKAAGAS